MSRNSIDLFYQLMKKGWINRKENPEVWALYESIDSNELNELEEGMNVQLINISDRLYMVPTQDNDLFLKNNIDYRTDIKADNTVKRRDLYLLNYLAVYILFLFFGSETSSNLRDLITREDLIELFTAHCEVAKNYVNEGNNTDYSQNFIDLADDWLAKTQGEPESRKMSDKYGIINRLISKFRADDLFYMDDNNSIKPTQKVKDLMPYFLRKSRRVEEIDLWIKERETYAADH